MEFATQPSVLGIVSPDVVLQMVEQIEEEEQSQMIRQLAGEEDPTRWSAAIAQWFKAHAVEKSVRLVDFYEELGMPLLEVWIGLLLGGFELEQHGNSTNYREFESLLSNRFGVRL